MPSQFPFKSDLVIEERINEATFRAYHVGFDQNRFRLNPLVDLIRKVIPEFSLGYLGGRGIQSVDVVEQLKLAAETVFATDKYQRRGEFGELILHLLLRDFCGSIPLISKVWFKDSHDSPVHGFDGVHVTTEDRKLWLGESKLYSTGSDGVRGLVDDLKRHFEENYLRKEFSLIARKLPNDFPEIEYWRRLMHSHTRLSDIYSGIVVPMVCTYSSSLFKKHSDETAEYIADFQDECRKLFSQFEKQKIKTSFDVILMLLPVPCKDELSLAIFQRLKKMREL